MINLDQCLSDAGVTKSVATIRRGGPAMPLYVIERHFAEQLEVTRDSAAEVRLINDQVGVHWLFSFLSADKKKTFCLYEASSAEAIREAARLANLPADVITEVTELRPEAFV
jgi:Protein of unknown function (DUF4242)